MNKLLYFSMILILLSILITIIRIFTTTSNELKVLGVDILVVIMISMMAIISVFAKTLFYLDVAMVLGIISFLSTVYFTIFLEGEAKNE